MSVLLLVIKVHKDVTQYVNFFVGNIISSAACRCVLRERVYASTLDYFSVKPRFPLQKGDWLKDDIIIVIKFWQAFSSEKKYYKQNGRGMFVKHVNDTLIKNVSHLYVLCIMSY